MNKDLLYAAALSMEEVYFTKGQHIIIQDQVGDTFYLIEEGQVVVTVSSPSLI
jgi:CRP-like cAMP-binding protein